MWQVYFVCMMQFASLDVFSRLSPPLRHFVIKLMALVRHLLRSVVFDRATDDLDLRFRFCIFLSIVIAVSVNIRQFEISALVRIGFRIVCSCCL